MKKIQPKFNEKEVEMFKDIGALLYIAQEVYGGRTRANLKQKELASLVGTTQRIISNIENAEINIGFNLLLRIARVLNITLVFGDHKFVSLSSVDLFKGIKIDISDSQKTLVRSGNDSSFQLFNLEPSH